jgi:hypothetical protein
MPGELPRQSHLDELREWAAARGLEIRTDAATQYEPTHLVSVHGSEASPSAAALIKRESSDSIETAAYYMLNTLRRLGAMPDE